MAKQILQSVKRVLPLAIGIVFMIAGLSKLANLQEFHDSLANLPFLNGTLTGLVSIILPNVEATLGACLILRNHSRTIFSATAVLSLCFVLVTIYWIEHGMKRNCGCFGSVTSAIGSRTWILVRNLALLTASVANCCAAERTRQSGDSVDS